MERILCSDWLPKRVEIIRLARFSRENFVQAISDNIINSLLNKLV